MQGLADGYFVLPYTIGDYLAPLLGATRAHRRPGVRRRRAAVDEHVTAAPVDQRGALGRLVPPRARQDRCGTTAAWRAAARASRRRWRDPGAARGVQADVRVLGRTRTLNQSLEKAGRVADFLEFGELLCSTRSTARSAAAATSAWSTRPRTARRCATTTTSPTSRRGSSPASARAGAAQGAARVRVRPPRAPELQVSGAT